MSQETAAGGDAGITVTESIASLVDAYQAMEMETTRYLLLVLSPSVVFFLGSVVVALRVELPPMVRFPIPLLGLLITAAALLYPQLVINKRRGEIEDKLHLFITHMTVLSTTNIDRMAVFRTLAAEEEYGELAVEIGRVVQLVDTWNQSLDDGLRRRAGVVPSKPLSDFFDRLSYTLGAGQELSDFLLSEQSVMIENYVTVYESALNNLEVMKDLYLSMILSMTFALVFAIVLPILTGNNPTMTVAAVLVLFMFIQTGFYMVIRTMAPFDPVWYHPDDHTTASERRTQLSLLAGAGLTFALIGFTFAGRFGIIPVTLNEVVFFVDPLPRPLYVAIPIVPMLVPGLVFRREETEIVARDTEFPSFIRALGATESAKQSTTTNVLETLRKKDFGPLTENIDDLYKRLNMRLDSEKAWRLFAADTRSYLVQKFSEMYLIGRQMGGDPKQLGELISENMNVVNQLRERRKQATITLIGLLYGITASSAFAFYIGLEVVNILANMSLGIESSGVFDAAQLIHTGVYNIPLVEYLLLLLILFNAVLSSLMIRAIDGGHKANTYIHFVLMTWVGCLIAIGTRELISAILTI